MGSTVFTYSCNDALIERCYSGMQVDGVFCLEGALAKEYLDLFRAEVDSKIKTHGSKYFSLIQPYKEAGSEFANLAKSDDFKALLRGLAMRAGCQVGSDVTDPYNVLRVIAGPKGTAQSLKFHYDATVVTALVPIYIPDGVPSEAGDLVAAVNVRPIRKSVFRNLVDKALLQNYLGTRILSRRLLKPNDDSNIYRLKPGNIYLFWGYRTAHANLPVRSNSVRSTLLFHFGDPHSGSIVTNTVLKVRRMRQRLEVI